MRLPDNDLPVVAEALRNLIEAGYRIHTPDGVDVTEAIRHGLDSGVIAGATTTCGACGGRIEYLDPTGDGLAAWWAHEHHPADDHPAAP